MAKVPAVLYIDSHFNRTVGFEAYRKSLMQPVRGATAMYNAPIVPQLIRSAYIVGDIIQNTCRWQTPSLISSSNFRQYADRR